MSQFIKTPKGTELPILNLKGKRYLPVAQRLVWFVEENPFYDISTTVKMLSDDSALCTAVIQILKENPDPSKGVMIVKRVTATKVEDKKGFADFIEKSETGSIGRALALLGYGTQFTGDEFNENNRLADSPIETVAKSPAKDPFAAAISAPSSFRKNNMKPVVPTEG